MVNKQFFILGLIICAGSDLLLNISLSVNNTLNKVLAILHFKGGCCALDLDAPGSNPAVVV